MGKNLKYSIVCLTFFVFGIFLSTNVFAYNNLGSSVCECNSCDDCTNALNDNINCSSIVKLNQSITTSGTCIDNSLNFTNKIFDCQGNTIQGAGNDYNYGMYLRSNNEIINNEIIQCLNKYNITSDTVAFYHASWCPHCQKMEPWVKELENQGYKFLWAQADSQESTMVANVKIAQECYKDVINFGGGIPQFGCAANGQLHIGEFMSKEEMKNFAEKCKQDALYPSRDNNTIKNCTIKNFYIGIVFDSTLNNTIMNNTITENTAGILLYHSSNDTITNNTINLNYYGAYIYFSNFSKILNNEILNNSYGLFSNNSATIISNNTFTNLLYDIFKSGILNFLSDGDNNTCDLAIGWNDNNAIGCTHSYIEVKEGKKADDIFDVVEMLEYLNNRTYLTHGMSYYNLNNDNTINLLDVFALIDKI